MNNKSLVLDLLDWLEAKPRTYTEVMRAWRTSCPRLPIWEDAVDLGLVARANGSLVEVTAAGRRLLSGERRAQANAAGASLV